MESIILEIKRTLLQQIPNGLNLIFAISSVIACVFILVKRRHHAAFYLCFWLLVLFMLLWRTIVGIVATRYVALLLIPVLMLTAFVGLRLESFWLLLHRRFPALPRRIGKYLPRVYLLSITAGALLMAHHSLSADQDVYTQIYRYIRQHKAETPELTVFMPQIQAERARYYSGVPIIGLPVMQPKEIMAKLNEPAFRGKEVLIVIRTSSWSVPVFDPKGVPGGAELKLVHVLKGEKKRKAVFFYRCTWAKDHKKR